MEPAGRAQPGSLRAGIQFDYVHVIIHPGLLSVPALLTETGTAFISRKQTNS